MNGHIREAVAEDLTSLLKILRENIPNYFAPEEEQDFLDYFEHKREDYYVIEVNGIICGAGGINYHNQKALISWDFISPNMQQKGLGKKLVQHRIHVILAKGFNQITVRTSQFTHEFYAKNGFKLTKVIPDYWATGYDLYEMDYQLI